jgi:hypothetical protein
MTLEEAHNIQATTCNTTAEWKEPDPRWIEAVNVIRAAEGRPPWQPETPDPELAEEFAKRKEQP